MSTLMYLDDFGEYILVISIHTQMFHLRFSAGGAQGKSKRNSERNSRKTHESSDESGLFNSDYHDFYNAEIRNYSRKQVFDDSTLDPLYWGYYQLV